jgi:hypothetical protein
VSVDIDKPPASAVGLSAIRGISGGRMRQYSSVEFTRGWNGVEHFLRQLRAVGYVKPCKAGPSYAVLDVLDADGDIIGNYDIPTAAAFRYVKRKLKLTVEPEVSGTESNPTEEER